MKINDNISPAIQMVDLSSQYFKIKSEIDEAITKVVTTSQFINGPEVRDFEDNLSAYLDNASIICCGNGTDALQIALMALDLQPGDEVIVPAFTYVACAEVIALLRLVPVWADVHPLTFNLDVASIEKFISTKTKAIIAVHLFGQCTPMEDLMMIAEKHSLFVIEDNAQSLGAEYIFKDGTHKKAGTIGHIGCTSFFPSKILGCFGDGGALITHDKELATRLKMIANHGQKHKYHHEIIGVNSRLDTIQAAILNVKLKYIKQYIHARISVAKLYDEAFEELSWIEKPYCHPNSTHVFHQYTIVVTEGRSRDELKQYLYSKGIPSMVYYPLPLHKQNAYMDTYRNTNRPVSELLCDKVLSLPIHTEMQAETIYYISDTIKSF